METKLLPTEPKSKIEARKNEKDKVGAEKEAKKKKIHIFHSLCVWVCSILLYNLAFYNKSP